MEQQERFQSTLDKYLLTQTRTLTFLFVNQSNESALKIRHTSSIEVNCGSTYTYYLSLSLTLKYVKDFLSIHNSFHSTHPNCHERFKFHIIINHEDFLPLPITCACSVNLFCRCISNTKTGKIIVVPVVDTTTTAHNIWNNHNNYNGTACVWIQKENERGGQKGNRYKILAR